MSPQLAARIVGEFSPEGGLVVDPFTCAGGAVAVGGAGTGRCVITLSPDARALDWARARVEKLVPPERRGVTQYRTGDARQITELCSDIAGWADLITTCPPYAAGGAPGDDAGQRYAGAIGEIFAGCARLLKPGGLMVTATINTAQPADGGMADLASLTVVLAREAGLRYLQHVIALRVPITGGDLAGADEPDLPASCVRTDLLVFGRRPAQTSSPRATAKETRR